MQEIDDAILENSFWQESISKFKTNRIIQITSVFIALALISIPAYSMYSKYSAPEDEYQRELQYFVDYSDYGYISWHSQTDLQLNDEEVFTLNLSYEDFPEEAENFNIVYLNVMVNVVDYDNDNEETTGVGCAVDSGEDAYDSVSGIISAPNGESDTFETDYTDYIGIPLLELPEFETFPFITGYTVKEIEEMYETGDEIIGEYNFEFTGYVESGDSTFQCDRQDPNVTISYSIELEWVEVSVVEWNGGSLFGI